MLSIIISIFRRGIWVEGSFQFYYRTNIYACFIKYFVPIQKLSIIPCRYEFYPFFYSIRDLFLIHFSKHVVLLNFISFTYLIDLDYISNIIVITSAILTSFISYQKYLPITLKFLVQPNSYRSFPAVSLIMHSDSISDPYKFYLISNISYSYIKVTGPTQFLQILPSSIADHA